MTDREEAAARVFAHHYWGGDLHWEVFSDDMRAELMRCVGKAIESADQFRTDRKDGHE